MHKGTPDRLTFFLEMNKNRVIPNGGNRPDILVLLHQSLFQVDLIIRQKDLLTH